MKNFWDKVSECEHKNLSEYFEFVYCPTPYCKGHELRCSDCNVYITECGCGSCRGKSGWPEKRRDNKNRRLRWKL